MKKYKKLHSEDNVIRQLQDNIEVVISPIIDSAIIDGVLLKNIHLTTGSIDVVSHKLGRTPLGYLIVKRSAESTIWESETNKRSINLNCSANVTVSIWVF